MQLGIRSSQLAQRLPQKPVTCIGRNKDIPGCRDFGSPFPNLPPTFVDNVRDPYIYLNQLTFTSMANKASRIIPGRYPPAGTSPVADAIRARRGARGITPLDAALLHVPPVAGGWNSLLGAIRTQGNLPGNVRELMVRFHSIFSYIH